MATFFFCLISVESEISQTVNPYIQEVLWFFLSRKNRKSASSLKLNNGDTAVTLAKLTDTEGLDARILLKCLPKRFFERPRTLTVYQSHGMEAGNRCLVKILVNGAPSLVARHSAQIYLVTEIAADTHSVRAGILLLSARDDARIRFDKSQI